MPQAPPSSEQVSEIVVTAQRLDAARATIEPSLGATILATGLVTRPKTAATDPLAPIRRMTQAEKIAFFS